jgi:hypothetical protein
MVGAALPCEVGVLRSCSRPKSLLSSCQPRLQHVPPRSAEIACGMTRFGNFSAHLPTPTEPYSTSSARQGAIRATTLGDVAWDCAAFTSLMYKGSFSLACRVLQGFAFPVVSTVDRSPPVHWQSEFEHLVSPRHLTVCDLDLRISSTGR